MTRALKDIFSDGFPVQEQHEKHADFALLSLRASLSAYFETYAAVGRNLANVERDDPKFDPKYYYSYTEAYLRAVLHAHHFAELVIKKILRDKYRVLALRVDKLNTVLFDLLDGKNVPDEELQKVNTPEFGESLDRLVALVPGRISSKAAQQIKDNAALLRKLNVLRNRVWHRGTFVLHYSALDELFGGHLLGLFASIANAYGQGSPKPIWRYTPLACGLDPVDEIVKEYQQASPSQSKVALLKEMARAAYHAPAYFDPRRHTNARQVIKDVWWMTARKTEEAKAARLSQSPDESLYDIVICPVCGLKTLLRRADMIDPDDVDGKAICLVWEVHCTCCTFTVPNNLGNPTEHGYTQIPDLFEGHEL